MEGGRSVAFLARRRAWPCRLVACSLALSRAQLGRLVPRSPRPCHPSMPSTRAALHRDPPRHRTASTACNWSPAQPPCHFVSCTHSLATDPYQLALQPNHHLSCERQNNDSTPRSTLLPSVPCHECITPLVLGAAHYKRTDKKKKVLPPPSRSSTRTPPHFSFRVIDRVESLVTYALRRAMCMAHPWSLVF